MMIELSCLWIVEPCIIVRDDLVTGGHHAQTPAARVAATSRAK
jgi:hypothetical protein